MKIAISMNLLITMVTIKITYLKEMGFLFTQIVITTLESGNDLKLMGKGLISIFKEWDLLVHGKMITSMERENNSGRMEQFLRESFFKVLKFLVNFPGQMELLIQVSLNKIDLKVKGSSLMKMEGIITVNGKTIWCKVMDNFIGQMVRFLKVNMILIKRTVKGCLFLVMGRLLRQIGKMEKFMVQVESSKRMDNKK